LIDFFIFDTTKELSIPECRLELDVDPRASRIVIGDRTSMGLIYSGKARANMVVHVPQSYVNASRIFTTIFDDSGEFNAATIDGINPEIVI
jgi:hypothetical protein